MKRLFDAYVIADWTAGEGRKTGEQSLWVGVMKRDVRFRLVYEAHNPGTRAEGEALIASILTDLNKRGDRALVGFDFALGYPQGTAEKLKLSPADWSGMWKFIADNVVDKRDNTNNRFAVAAKINRLMTDAPEPFWGCPASQAQRWLKTTKSSGFAGLPEFRATELAARKGRRQPKSVWQMHGAGAVGGQSLVGIAAVHRLMTAMGASAAVWPFGTGWRGLEPSDVEPLSALFVEVWPSLFDITPEPGEVKDAAQVRITAETFARLDEKGELGALFAPPAGVDAAMVAQVEREEGWILGVRQGA